MSYPLYYNGVTIGTVEHSPELNSLNISLKGKISVAEMTIETIVKEGELIAFEVINKTIYY